MDFVQADAWASAYSAVAAGAALVAGLGFLAFLRRSNSWIMYDQDSATKEESKDAGAWWGFSL